MQSYYIPAKNSDVFQATSLRVRRLAKNRRTSSPLTRKAVTAIHTMRTTEGVPSGSRAAKRSYPICTKSEMAKINAERHRSQA